MNERLKIVVLTMVGAVMLLMLGAGTALCADPGNALSFDGVDDYVNCGAINPSQFTLEAWVKVNSLASSGAIISKIYNAAPNQFKNLELRLETSGKIYFAAPNGTAWNGITSDTALSVGVWYHVAATCNGTTGKIYINGVPDPNTLATSYVGTNDSLFIGARPVNLGVPSFFFNGQMDEVRIWSAARTQAEILSTMRKPLAGNEAGLLAYYNFNQTAGTALPDVTGKGNNGTLTNGPAWTASGAVFEMTAPGNALAFDGVDDSADAPSSFSGTLSIEAWIKPSAITGYHEIVCYGDSGNSGNTAEFRLTPAGNIEYGQAQPGVSWSAFSSSTSIAPGVWTHVSVVKSGTNASLYINGKLDKTGSITNSPTVNRLYIGSRRYSGSNNQFFKGLVDEIRIWNIARTEAQIQADVNRALSGTESGLAAYYRFDHKTGTTLTDFTANGNHGTLKNMAATAWTASGAMCPTMVAPGNALTFDGTDDSADAPSTFSGTLSIEAWIKPSAITGYHEIVCYGDSGNSGNAAEFRLTPAGNLEYGQAQPGVSWSAFSSGTSIAPGVWTHVSVVKSGTNASLYINGKLDKTGSITNSPTVNRLYIGSRRYSGSNNQFFKGLVDEIRIWNIARTQAQIQADMHRALNGNETGLAAYYRFDYKSGTTMNDITANGNHAALNNMADTAWTASGAMCPIVKPATKITAAGFTANWDAVNGATGYRIDVDDSADFSSPIKSDTDAGTGSFFAVTGLNLTPGSLYYYRIRALKSDWLSPNSAAASFTGMMEPPGNALSFDGVDDYVKVGNSASFETANGTVELWICPSWTTPPAAHPCIIGNREDTAVRYSVHIKNDKSGITFYNGAAPVWMPYTFENDKWYHIAVVVSGAKHEIFINGISAGTGNIGFSTSTGIPLHIGDSGKAGEFFKGKIDEVRIWNTARTQIEILTTMNKPLAGDETGLAAYYNFDQLSGAVLPDVAGQGHNGAVTNAPAWVASGAMSEVAPEPNNALSYDGTDDYVQMNDVKLGTSDFTIEGWIKPTGTVGQMYIYTNRTGEGEAAGNWFALSLQGGKILVELGTCASSYKSFLSVSALNVNSWHHIALVRNPTTVTLYVNGVKDVSVSDNSSLRNLTSGKDITRFGGWPDYSSKWYKGQIDEFRVWSTARTEAEILAGMSKTLKGNEAGLAAYYNFDQSGTELTDITGKGHNGTLKNGPIWVPSPVPDASVMPKNALSFDGTDDAATSAGFINLTGNDTFTISAWVKPTAIKEAIFASVGKTYLGIGMDASGKFISKSSAGTNNSGFTLSTGVWYHLAAVFSGGQSTLYVNGVKTGSVAACSNTGGSNLAVVMGHGTFKGEMDEVCLWKTARTQDEIRNSMSKDVSGQTGLLAYYSFNQGTAGGNNAETAIAIDLAGGHNAALNNFTLVGSTSNFVGSSVIFEPTRQASAANCSNVLTDSVTLNWTNGNGSSRMVLVKADSEIDSPPADRTAYTGNAAFGAGTQIGTGCYVVYSGTGSTVNVTGLEPKKYYAAVYEFNGSGGQEDYMTISPATVNFSLLPKTVKVNGVNPIGATAAVANATAAGFPITERGFSVTSGVLLPSGSGEGDFVLTLTGLKAQTAYSLRAYIKVDGQTIYSDPFALTTTNSDAGLAPTVQTDTANCKLDGSTMNANAKVTNIGIAPVTAYGFLYGDHEKLGTADKKVSFAKTIAAGASFSSKISGLTSGTYWVCAYAENSVGMGLGEEFSFTVTVVGPKVFTCGHCLKVTALSGGGKSVKMEGRILETGNMPVIVYGFVYANHTNPTLWDNVAPFKDMATTVAGSAPFAATVNNIPSGKYYYKAFAFSGTTLSYGGGFDYNFSVRQARDDASNNETMNYGEEFSFTIRDGSLTGLPGDVNGDGQTDIADAVLALQIAAGITPVQPIFLSGDVNGDDRIGMEEVVYILQNEIASVYMR